VRLVGDDRASFLHGMCTADIGKAKAGDLLRALFLTEHAHLIADFVAWIEPKSILIEVDARLWSRARSQLESLLVADDVEFEETGLEAISIAGPRAAEAAGAIVADVPSDSHFTASGGVLAGRLQRFGAPSVTILAPGARAQEFVAQALATGCAEVTESAAEIVRIEQGIAQVGVDTNEKTIALEAGFRDAISFEKGCYVGQETLERVTARGGLHKKLLGLTFRNALPDPDAALTLAEKEMGRATSVGLSPRFGAIGLAILHQSAWAEGTELEVGGGGRAVVTGLPFHP